MNNKKKIYITFGICMALSALAGAQLNQILRIGGVAAAVKLFGRQMNDGLNSITKHKDSSKEKTKVVVILSVGLGSSNAIGAAQVMGPPEKVDQVVAVAQPEASLFGHEVRIRGLIPVATKDVSNITSLRTVDGVGISGLVDLKL